MRRRLWLIAVSFAAVSGLHCVGDEPAAPGGSSDDGGAGDGSTGDASEGDGASGDAASGITVNGSMYFGSPTTPVPNRDVVVIDANETVTKLTTGADGTFHASGVVTPYDIFVPYVSPDGGAAVYPLYFAGLTRTDPAVFGVPYDLGSGGADTQRAAPISFTYSGCTGCTVWVSGMSDAFNAVGTGASHVVTGRSYRWFGGTTLNASLHYIYQDATGAFTSYDESNSFLLTDTATTNIGSLTAGTALPTSPTLTVNSSLPGGYTYDHTSVEFYHADGARLAYETNSTLSSSARVPATANVKIQVYASGKGPNNASDSAHVTYVDYTSVPSSLALALPAAPTLLTPADAAMAITAAQKLTWTAFSGPAYYFVEIATDAGFDLEVYASGTELDLGRLAKAGVPLPSAQKTYWHVASDSSVPSMDEYTRPGGATPAAPGTPTYGGVSGYQTFTTQ